MLSSDFWPLWTPLRVALLIDLSCSIIAHAWFKKYEPRNVSSCLSQLSLFAFAPVVTAVITLQSPWVNGPLHLIIFVFFLLNSIFFYRISPVHPLAEYPGPMICKITKIWTASISQKGKLHLYHNDLHKKYGPIIRIGPNELSVVDVDLLPHIMGMPKGPMWDGRPFVYHKQWNNSMSLIAVRDTNIHAQLRKPWNRSFGGSALEGYKETLVTSGNELIQRLRELCRNSEDTFAIADISEYIEHWSFDFMGEIAFGENFGLMRNGDKDGILNKMKATCELHAFTQAIPWAHGFVCSLPGYKDKFGGFSDFAIGLAQKRVTKVTEKKDLVYHLAVNMDIDDEKPPVPWMISNMALTIVAGSDTTSAILIGVIYHLNQHPSYFQRLREELDQAFPSSEHAVIQLDKLLNLELLNAIINEVLRLQPPVSTGLQRAPARGSGGRLIGDMFIHEGTAVTVPSYVLHRDPRYFYPKPDEFWPDRWLIQSDKIILNRSAFIPFSSGPANCAGKSLAILELRYITAMLVYHFDFRFDDGYDPSQWNREMLDHFNVVLGKLPVKLKLRDF